MLIICSGRKEHRKISADELKRPHVQIVRDPYTEYTCHIVVEWHCYLQYDSFPESIWLLFCLLYVFVIACPMNKCCHLYVHVLDILNSYTGNQSGHQRVKLSF